MQSCHRVGYTGPVQLFTEPSDVWEAYIGSFGDHHMWFLSEGKEVGGSVFFTRFVEKPLATKTSWRCWSSGFLDPGSQMRWALSHIHLNTLFTRNSPFPLFSFTDTTFGYVNHLLTDLL